MEETKATQVIIDASLEKHFRQLFVETVEEETIPYCVFEVPLETETDQVTTLQLWESLCRHAGLDAELPFEQVRVTLCRDKHTVLRELGAQDLPFLVLLGFLPRRAGVLVDLGIKFSERTEDESSGRRLSSVDLESEDLDTPSTGLRFIATRLPSAFPETEDEFSELFFESSKIKGFKAEKCGYLEFRTAKIWRNRWFVLIDDRLYYYKTHLHKHAEGFIPLQESFVRRIPVSSVDSRLAQQLTPIALSPRTAIFENFSRRSLTVQQDSLEQCESESTGYAFEIDTMYQLLVFRGGSLSDVHQWVSLLESKSDANAETKQLEFLENKFEHFEEYSTDLFDPPVELPSRIHEAFPELDFQWVCDLEDYESKTSSDDIPEYFRGIFGRFQHESFS
jgi:hypothetical protein